MKTQFRRIAGTLAIALLMVLVLAACSGNRIDATLANYQISLSSTSASAGSVTFRVTNNAEDMLHEFVIVKSDLAADSLPLNDDGDVDEDQITVVDEIEDIESGSTEFLTVDLDPGHYVIMCNLPGHYAQGMHVDFTVTP